MEHKGHQSIQPGANEERASPRGILFQEPSDSEFPL